MITSNGEVVLNGTLLKSFHIDSHYFIKKNYADSKIAVISADSDTKYQYLVTVMDVLNRNNFDRVEINATELK